MKMTEEKTCHNCGNKNCNVYYSIVKKDCKRHYETYEYSFDCVNHDKWDELRGKQMTKDELRKEATFTIEWESTPMIDRPLFVHAYITGALPREKRIEELEKENAELKTRNGELAGKVASLGRWFGEAKEIMEELLKALDGRSGFDEDVFWRAEQFLKEK